MSLKNIIRNYSLKKSTKELKEVKNIKKRFKEDLV